MINWRLLIVGLMILGAACGRASNARTYQLTGQILVVKPETNEVLVKHQDIPGFMPAMTMPYVVKDPALIKERVAGDLITATLVVGEERAYLSTITRTGSAPLPEDAQTAIPVAAGVHILQAGDAVPNTPLTDQDGKSIRLSDFRGSAVAVSFIYTRCPLPQFCPLIDRRFSEVQNRAVDDPVLKGKLKLVSISFDPAFDQPAVLRVHARKLGANPTVWRFATAGEPIVDRLAAQFGINVIREKDGTITHNLRSAVINRSGQIVSIVDNNTWTAADLVNALKNAAR
ncbi:MAG TPA: SCO family protein [Vicinamibacterales bacterium]|nr:SCO family protein [Vicinamibacterales bacterium]